MRKYEYKLEIVESSDEFCEGSNEFWESLQGTGCEKITDLLEECLFETGFLVNNEDSPNKLTLVSYSNSE